jgi:cytidylate kinase
MHRLEQLAKEARIGLEFAPARVFLNGEDVTVAIRSPDVSDAASKVSAVPSVRRALVEKQRRMAAEGCVVMEGRDIGSVVFPDAEVKVFLDASPAVRADRRLRELREKGEAAPLDQVAREMEERDLRDRGRSDSPLVRAPDAAYVDTTGLSLDEVEGIILGIVRDRTSKGKE